jgi:hypothetical protein
MQFYKNFSKKRNKTPLLKGLLLFFNSLSFKTKTIVLSFFGITSYMVVRAQITSPVIAVNTAQSILQMINPDADHAELAKDFAESSIILQITKRFINYIVNIQLESVQIISSTSINGNGMFDTIIKGLTIFAAIASFYKLLQHFLNTERFDNAKAFTGFFGYISIFVLFIFSGPIVQHVASLNRNINTSNISNISNQIQSEIDTQILKDWTNLKTKYDAYDKAIEVIDNPLSVEKAALKISQSMLMIKFNVKNTIFTIYMSFFSMFLMSALSIPTVIMTIMVKVTLSIMILGAKLVFLLAFIPGFENVWKTYMLNMLNVLLWVPIFNVIISFLLAIVSGTISDGSIGTGQIIWLSILAIIFAKQSISLTTTTANTIINGAGAGIAGAMGSLTSMGATSMMATGGAVVAGGAVIAATGGSAAPMVGAAAANKFSKE